MINIAQNELVNNKFKFDVISDVTDFVKIEIILLLSSSSSSTYFQSTTDKDLLPYLQFGYILGIFYPHKFCYRLNVFDELDNRNKHLGIFLNIND